jgi:HTH-type transcriptional regulator/antitoxin HigA
VSIEGTEELTPDWAIDPGTVLSRVLEERGLRQSDLAERTGLSAKHINQVVKNKVPISGDVAMTFERALGTPAAFWLRVTADHEAHESARRANQSLAKFADWARSFDRTTLLENDIIKSGDPVETVAEKLLRFFGVASPAAYEDTYVRPRVSFRRAQQFEVAGPNTALWLRLVELKAQPDKAKDLNIPALKRAASLLPRMSALPVVDGFAAARDSLAEAGVSLVFVPEIPGTRICAATWWFGSDRPVIGITGRHKGVDTLWFNLMHEIGHILLHPRRSSYLDLDGDMKASDGAEEEANKFAQMSLVPREQLPRLMSATTPQDLALLASELNVGLPVVAGQYAFHAHDPNAYKAVGKIRSKITDTELEELTAV